MLLSWIFISFFIQPTSDLVWKWSYFLPLQDFFWFIIFTDITIGRTRSFFWERKINLECPLGVICLNHLKSSFVLWFFSPLNTFLGTQHPIVEIMKKKAVKAGVKHCDNGHRKNVPWPVKNFMFNIHTRLCMPEMKL